MTNQDQPKGQAELTDGFVFVNYNPIFVQQSNNENI